MKKKTAILIILAAASLRAQRLPEQCTAAAAGSRATQSGRPLLWKNRDTGVLLNKVVYVQDLPHSYLGLVNNAEASGRHTYAGLNDSGFAVMNTVAYNLPGPGDGLADLEGIIMGDALRTCASIDDFEKYLINNLGPGLGSLANFGVMDSTGRAAVFEVHNGGYTRFDTEDTSGDYMIVTNFARSGEADEGAGYLRFQRAEALFGRFGAGTIDYKTILHTFTRDVGHVLLDHPENICAGTVRLGADRWISTRDCINKSYTSAAVVIQGREPSDPRSRAVMWVIPGEPLCAVAVPLWVEARRVPPALCASDTAAMWRESMRIKDIVRPVNRGNMGSYLDLEAAAGRGSGFLQSLLETELSIIRDTERFIRSGGPDGSIAPFQERMADRALEAMKRVK